MAFYHVAVRMRQPNLKVTAWGFDLETPAELTAASIQDLADTVSAEWLTNAALYATDQELLACTVQGFERVQDSAGPPPVAHREPTTTEFVGAGADVAGTAAGQSVAPQNALVVTFRTASPERRALGRAYTHAPPESVVDGAGLVSDNQTRETMVADIVAAAEGAIAPIDVDHVVFSTRYGDQNEVITYEANEILDTQRRRASR